LGFIAQIGVLEKDRTDHQRYSGRAVLTIRRK